MEKTLGEFKAEVVNLLEILKKEDLTALELEGEEFKIGFRKGRKAVVVAPVTGTQANIIPIVSNLVGIFHIKAKGKEVPIVKVGDSVQDGQILCFLESMRLMHDVRAPQAGKVLEILVDEGNAVEYGQILIILEV
jgi:biotin carboxyl carrier protein